MERLDLDKIVTLGGPNLIHQLGLRYPDPGPLDCLDALTEDGHLRPRVLADWAERKGQYELVALLARTLEEVNEPYQGHGVRPEDRIGGPSPGDRAGPPRPDHLGEGTGRTTQGTGSPPLW